MKTGIRLALATALAALTVMSLAAISMAAPAIDVDSSSTNHRSQDHWYNSNDPAFGLTLRPFSETAVPGVLRVAVAGDRAYVAGASSLQVIDIADAVSPTVLGSVDIGSSAYGIVIDGGNAYLSRSGSGTDVFDVSDPAAPSFVSHIDGYTRDIAASGDRLYVSGPDGLRIYDISDRANPVLAGTFMGNAAKMSHHNGLIYLTAALPDNSMRIVDATDPANPFVRGTYVGVGNVSSMGIVENAQSGRLYLYVHSGGGSPISVLDVTDPASPALTSLVSGPDYDFMAVSGNTMSVYENFVWTHDADLKIYDISDPAVPVYKRSIPLTPKGSFYGSGIAVSGVNTYVVGTDTLRIYTHDRVDFSYVLDSSPSTVPDAAADGYLDNYYDRQIGFTDVADGELYLHVAAIDSYGIGPVVHRRIRVDADCSVRPALTVQSTSARWDSYADYVARVLTVDFTMENATGPLANGTTLVGAQSTNGVSVTSAMPHPLIDLWPGGHTYPSLRYSVPAGVSYFRTSLFATATDACGGSLAYPGPYSQP